MTDDAGVVVSLQYTGCLAKHSANEISPETHLPRGSSFRSSPLLPVNHTRHGRYRFGRDHHTAVSSRVSRYTARLICYCLQPSGWSRRPGPCSRRRPSYEYRKGEKKEEVRHALL